MGKGARSCDKLLLLLCVALRAGALAATLPSDKAAPHEADSCAGVRHVFHMNNMSVDVPAAPISGRELAVCTSERSCCTRQMEAELQMQVRRDFQAMLHHNSRSLEGLLVSAANTITDHVVRQLRQSLSRARPLVSRLLGGLPAAPHDPLSALYGRLEAQLQAPPPQQQQSSALAAAAMDAWWRLLPLAYQRAAGDRRLAPQYRACVRLAAEQLRPLENAPGRLAAALQRALGAAALLRGALLQGAAVLNRTHALLTGGAGGEAAQAQCHAALLRMSYCSRCHGLHRRVRPCAGLCLNVLRGCLTRHAAELDLPWSGYVEAAERLLVAVQGRDHVDDALRALDGRIVEAVMAAIERSATLQQQVKRVCGPHMWDYGVASAERSDSAGEDGQPPDTDTATASGADDEPLSSKLQPFLASLRKSRGFYANLAESLCSDESFAETRDTADCWNGQRVGEYTKTVVASSPVAQKYNPELRWLPSQPDARIAELSDQLRHLKQVLVSQEWEGPRALPLVRYVEGSGGGGATGLWDGEGEAEDGWRDDGSGSGQQPAVVGGDTMSTDNTIHPLSDEDGGKRGTGASSETSPANRLLVVCGVLLTSRILYATNM